MARSTPRVGPVGAISATLLATAHGGGTYTLREAVWNNVNLLAEPSVQIGKRALLWVQRMHGRDRQERE